MKLLNSKPNHQVDCLLQEVMHPVPLLLQHQQNYLHSSSQDFCIDSKSDLFSYSSNIVLVGLIQICFCSDQNFWILICLDFNFCNYLCLLSQDLGQNQILRFHLHLFCESPQPELNLVCHCTLAFIFLQNCLLPSSLPPNCLAKKPKRSMHESHHQNQFLQMTINL